MMKKFSSSSFWLLFVLFVTSPHVMLSEKYHQLKLPGVIGPESIAFDCSGKGPYVGVSDGRILKWRGPHLGWTEFAITSPYRRRKLCDGSTDTRMEPFCGRPLGLKFNPKTCDLYIADAYFGLMVVGPQGGQAQKLASSAEGVPMRFTNALDIDTNTGHVYFTDSSMWFQRREYIKVMEGDTSGRLLKYDPHSKSVTVLHKCLSFPNGVALSKNNSFLLLAESNTMRVLRFWLHNGTLTCNIPQIFAQLLRFPDNIKRNQDGDFWVALNFPRGNMTRRAKDPVGLKFDENGKVISMLDPTGEDAIEFVSEVEQHGGSFYMGSPSNPYVGVLSR